jgi:hypothetical protein
MAYNDNIQTYTGYFAGYELKKERVGRDGASTLFKAHFQVDGRKQDFSVFEPNKNQVQLREMVPGTAYSVSYYEKYVDGRDGKPGFNSKNVVDIRTSDVPATGFQNPPRQAAQAQGSTIGTQAGVSRLDEFKALYKAEHGLDQGKYHFIVSFLAWSTPAMLDSLKKLGAEYEALKAPPTPVPTQQGIPSI